MQRHIVETLVGALVLAIAVGFGWYAYSTTGHGAGAGSYILKARFDRVDGLTNGTDVRVSGIKVGAVTDVVLDPKTFFASVEIAIQDNVKLPIDSRAEIQTEGLLGGRYLNIVPGNDDDILPDGSNIRYTQAAVDFMQLLGRFMFSSNEPKDGAKSPPPPPGGAYPGAPAPQ
ncbi:outer membrane lipid asymmetry maintenance protein MlaD [Lacibacterium aquatile]|uniref:Outer membrane lipid asymmetry maintenance protein MlaD n=1 Tax=Lacibacterium aquatile TaxID=1168082 RepID=A0ABW5DM01_9PROT